MEQNVYTRSQLLDVIKSQTIHVPDLIPIFSSWPVAINPHWKDLIPVMDERIDSLFSDPIKAAKLKKCDFALFASTWWPTAGFDELCILAYLAFWLFTWDDEVDETRGSLSGDYEAAEQYRHETISFIAECLDLDVTGGGFPPSQSPASKPSHPIVRSFDVIGEALLEAYTYEQRQTFFDEMSYFMVMSQLEQKVKLTGRVPSLEQYWTIRMGTTAVGVIVAVNEFSDRTTVPRSVINRPSMKALWDEANIMVAIVNDIYSLKKEIAQNVIDSLIPVLCISLEGPQAAIDDAVQSLRESVDRFNTAASQIMSEVEEDPSFTVAAKKDVQNYVRSCRFNCTGNLYWSLRTNRYGMQFLPRSSDGGIILEL